MENGKSGLRAKLPGGLNVGIPGRGIASIVRTGGSGAPGTDDTYTITYTDGTTSTFTVHNGADGKTAYQYAVDGGYTGSEEDFAKMLAGGGGGAGYTLPVATAEKLGGVKAVAATEEMTEEVGIDAEGKLKVKPGGNVDYSVLGLGYGADGKLYILVNGIPTGSGVIVAAPVVDDIRLTDIVSYYQEPTLAVANEIDALDENWVSFIVVTDTHTEHNKNNSQNIIRYLLKHTAANRVFHLGDISDSWSESKYKAWFAPFENCMSQLFFALGNHDTWGSTAADRTGMYEDMLADKMYLKGKPENFYYYFDDVARKIRYLVINTSDGGNQVVSATQLSWIRESVQLPSSDWKLVSLGHVDINHNDPISGLGVLTNASDVVNALSSTNGKFVGYFCGHEHQDRIVFINDTIYQTILINDSCRQDTELPNWTNPERTAGTTSEHAVSVVSFNTVTGAVDIRRIGVGTDMEYNYLTQPEEPDNPEVTLSGISATYSGGIVDVGTTVNDLTGIVVTAAYSDGSTRTVTDYTLSGTIAEGENTITVSYGGMTTTFTVVCVVESGEEEPTIPENGLYAVYNTTKQSDHIVHMVFDTDTTDSLRDYLTVTSYTDGVGVEVTDYTLIGDLSGGNNVITVSHNGTTCTCKVPLMRWEVTDKDILPNGVCNSLSAFGEDGTKYYCNPNIKNREMYPLFVRAKAGYKYTLVFEPGGTDIDAAYEFYNSTVAANVKSLSVYSDSDMTDTPWTPANGVFEHTLTDTHANGQPIELLRFMFRHSSNASYNGVVETKRAVLIATKV